MAKKRATRQKAATEGAQSTAGGPSQPAEPGQEEHKEESTPHPPSTGVSRPVTEPEEGETRRAEPSKKEQKRSVRNTSATHIGAQRALEPQSDPSLRSNSVPIEQQPPGRPVGETQRPPLVNIQGNLKLDGVWNLQCYECEYVTEHLQLHRSPTFSPREERKPEDGKCSTLFAEDGILKKRPAGGPGEEYKPAQNDEDDYVIKTIRPGQQPFSKLQGRANPLIHGSVVRTIVSWFKRMHTDGTSFGDFESSRLNRNALNEPASKRRRVSDDLPAEEIMRVKEEKVDKMEMGQAAQDS